MDLKVFISTHESVCDECGEQLGHHAWITPAENKAFCLSCADMDHLIFLPAGDAALTRRAGKYSTLSAVVLKWSRTRKRYERQGLLLEESALQRAEQECLAKISAPAGANAKPNAVPNWITNTYNFSRRACANCFLVAPLDVSRSLLSKPAKNIADVSDVPQQPKRWMKNPF